MFCFDFVLFHILVGATGVVRLSTRRGERLGGAVLDIRTEACCCVVLSGKHAYGGILVPCWWLLSKWGESVALFRAMVTFLLCSGEPHSRTSHKPERPRSICLCAVEHVDPGLPYGVLCRTCVLYVVRVQLQETRLDHAGYPAPTRQHELDHTDHLP